MPNVIGCMILQDRLILDLLSTVYLCLAR